MNERYTQKKFTVEDARDQIWDQYLTSYELGFQYYSFDIHEYTRTVYREWQHGLRSPLVDILGPVKAALRWCWDNIISPGLRPMFDALKTAVEWIITPIKWIINSIKWVLDQAWRAIQNIGSVIWENLKRFGSIVADSLSKIWSNISSAVTSIGNRILNFVGEHVLWVFQKIGGAISDFGGWIWEHLQHGISDILENVTNALETFGGWVKDALVGVASAVAEGFRDFFTWLFTETWDLLRGVLGWLNRNVLTPIWEGLKGFANWIAELFVDAVMWAWKKLMPKTPRSPSPVLDMVIDFMRSALLIVSPIALSTIAGEFVHPLKRLGFGRLSAIMYDLGGFSEITRVLAYTYTLVAAGYPLRFELMNLARPMFPREELVARLLDRNVLPKDETYDLLHHAGFRDAFVDWMWEWHWDPPPEWASAKMVWWNQWGLDEWTEWMNRRGYRHDVLEKWWPTVYELPDQWEIAQMWWRGAISEEEFDTWVLRTGLHPELLSAKKQALYQYPRVEDMIRFAVKEAYSRPELSAGLELQEGLKRDSRLIGLPEHWLEMFWRAHWRLPSPGQLYESLHRGIIDRDVVDMYLRYNDYEPRCRDWLIGISWDLPGKRDIRWMYEAGEITDEEILDLTKKIGITEEWRERVAAAWRHMLKRSEINSLVRETRDDLENGWISEEEAENRLAALGIPEGFRSFTLNAALMERERDLRDDMADELIRLAEHEKISLGTCLAGLLGLGMERGVAERKVMRVELRLHPERIAPGLRGAA